MADLDFSGQAEPVAHDTLDFSAQAEPVRQVGGAENAGRQFVAGGGDILTALQKVGDFGNWLIPTPGLIPKGEHDDVTLGTLGAQAKAVGNLGPNEAPDGLGSRIAGGAARAIPSLAAAIGTGGESSLAGLVPDAVRAVPLLGRLATGIGAGAPTAAVLTGEQSANLPDNMSAADKAEATAKSLGINLAMAGLPVAVGANPLLRAGTGATLGYGSSAAVSALQGQPQDQANNIVGGMMGALLGQHSGEVPGAPLDPFIARYNASAGEGAPPVAPAGPRVLPAPDFSAEAVPATPSVAAPTDFNPQMAAAGFRADPRTALAALDHPTLVQVAKDAGFTVKPTDTAPAIIDKVMSLPTEQLHANVLPEYMDAVTPVVASRPVETNPVVSQIQPNPVDNTPPPSMASAIAPGTTLPVDASGTAFTPQQGMASLSDALAKRAVGGEQLSAPVTTVDSAGVAKDSGAFLRQAQQAMDQAQAAHEAEMQKRALGITPDIERTQAPKWEAAKVRAQDIQDKLDAQPDDEIATQRDDDSPPWWVAGQHESDQTDIARAAAETAKIEPLRSEIGWDTIGGKMLRAPEEDGQGGHAPVSGRTPWVGKSGHDGASDFWRMRPEQGGKISEVQAHAALDKASAGQPLNAKEQRFVDYAKQVAGDRDAEYEKALAEFHADQADMSDADRLDASQSLREASIPPEDHAEALTVAQLINRAHDAGASPRQMRDAIAAGTTTEKARALWDLSRSLEDAHGTDSQAVRRGSEPGDQAQGGGQPVGEAAGQEAERAGAPAEPNRPVGSDLFAAPTARERLNAETANRDAARNGLGRDLVRPEQGAGDLLAGERPQQARVEQDIAPTIHDGPMRMGEVLDYAPGRVATVMQTLPGGHAEVRIEGTRNGKNVFQQGREQLSQLKKLPRLGRVTLGQDGGTYLSAKHLIPEKSVHDDPKVEQTVNDSDNGGVPTALRRPDWTPKVEKHALTEIDSLVERFQGSTLADSIAQDFHEHQGAALIGKTITSHEDLAAMASVYRNPAFETMRYMYVDDAGTVLGETAVSSRMPSSATAFPTGEDDGAVWLIKAAPKGATGIWMVHNHPSGNPRPSNADLEVTGQLAIQLGDIPRAPKVKGHVVLDHDTFGRISASGEDKGIGKLPSTGPDPLRAVRGADLFDVRMSSPAFAASTGKQIALMTPEDSSAVVVMAANGNVVSVHTFPNNVLTGPKGAALLARIGAKRGAVGLGIVTSSDNFAKYRDAFTVASDRNLLYDAVVVTPSGHALQMGNHPDLMPTRSLFGKHSAAAVKRGDSGTKVYEPDDAVQPEPPQISLSMVRDALRNRGVSDDAIAAMSKDDLRAEQASMRMRSQPLPEQKTTGVKNATKEEERAMKGKAAVEHDLSTSNPEQYAAAKARFDADPHAGQLVAAKVIADKKAITPEDSILLSLDAMRIINARQTAYEQAEKAMAGGDESTRVAALSLVRQLDGQMEANDIASRYSGVRAGQALQARKVMIQQDYSMARMVLRAKVAKGADLTDVERTRLEKAANDIAQRTKELDAREAAIRAKEREPRQTATRQTARAKFDDLAAQLKKIAQKDQLKPGCVV